MELMVDPPTIASDVLYTLLWESFKKECDQTTTMDSAARFVSIFKSLQPIIMDFAPLSSSGSILDAIKQWSREGLSSALIVFRDNRDNYHASPDAAPLLGKGSRHMYNFVRKELDVPFLRTSMLRQSGSDELRDVVDSRMQSGRQPVNGEVRSNITTGGLITRIYEAIRTGRLQQPVIECLAADLGT